MIENSIHDPGKACESYRKSEDIHVALRKVVPYDLTDRRPEIRHL